MANKHYEVWISLEEWDGDSKNHDVITSKVGNIKDLKGGKIIYQAVEEVVFALKPHLNPEIKIEDD
jgi:hypothetical protein